MTLFGIFATLLSSAAQSPQISADVRMFIENDLHLASYQAAPADLNGDGRHEIIVYAKDRGLCGTGGCTLYVLTPQGPAFRVLTKITVARPPIRILFTSSHGWRDLGVHVSGGGISQPYDARLQFNGQSYPTNPTIAPAAPMDMTGVGVLIQ